MPLVADVLPRVTNTLGQPYVNATVYFGVANADTRSNPIDVYQDEDKSVNLGSSLTTDAYGRFSFNGAHTTVHVFEPYSMEVYNGDTLIDSVPYGVGISAQIVSYSSIAELKAVVDPADGDTFLVTGYTTPGDGGGGQYYFDASETAADNGGTIIAPDSGAGRWKLLVDDSVFVEQFGATGDGTTLDTAAFTNAVAYSSLTSVPVWLCPDKTYLVAPDSISDSFAGFRCVGEAQIKANAADGYVVRCSGTSKTATTLAANASMGADRIQPASTADMVVGDLIRLKSNKAWYHDPRENSSISTATGTAQAGSASGLTVASGTGEAAMVGEDITIEAGTGAGQGRTVSGQSGDVLTLSRAWKTVPDNTSVYRFQQAHKGEMHRVVHIESGYVYLDTGLYDGYDVVDNSEGDGLEDVTIDIYTPVKPIFEGVTFTREHAASSTNSHGLRIEGSDSARLYRVSGENCANSGVQVLNSYNFRSYEGEAKSCDGDSLGYGLNIGATTLPYVKDFRAYDCRRGIDFTGGYAGTRQGTIDHAVIVGSYLTQAGNEFQPQGSTGSFGVGSHGNADQCRYINCEITQVDNAINVRGRNEYIENNFFYGWISDSCILADHGKNLTVIGNTYNNGWDQSIDDPANGDKETKQFTDNSGSIPADVRDRAPNDFVRIKGNFEPSRITVRDNTAIGIDQNLIAIENTGGLLTALNGGTVTGNRIHFAPRDGSFSHRMIWADSPLAIDGWEIYGNAPSMDGSLDNYFLLQSDVNPFSNDGAVNHFGDGRYSVQLNDDAFTSIRVGHIENSLEVKVTVAGGASDPLFHGLIDTSGTLVSMGVSAGVVNTTSNAVPDGTNSTDGNTALHYDNDFLYVQNREGAATSYYITIHPSR